MEKIKNATHLREQKMNLRVKELELEKQIHKDWSGIREKLQPKHILAGEHGINHDHLLIKTVAAAFSRFSERMIEKAEAKIESMAEKRIERLSSRISKIFSTKK